MVPFESCLVQNQNYNLFTISRQISYRNEVASKIYTEMDMLYGSFKTQPDSFAKVFESVIRLETPFHEHRLFITVT